MVWDDGPLTLYHGTDHESSYKIRDHGVNWRIGDPYTDFGLGFYTTTRPYQAKNWANNRCRLLHKAKHPKRVHAAVISFEIDRSRFDGLSILSFVLTDSNTDFWDLIKYCRGGNTPHRPKSCKDYDIVFGPVTLWPQGLIINDCDQMSFHTDKSNSILDNRSISDEKSTTDPFFPI
jgi:hypothetical protein